MKRVERGRFKRKKYTEGDGGGRESMARLSCFHRSVYVTCVSGIMGFSSGLELKKEDRGDVITRGSGRTNPLRSQPGIVFSSVFSISVSMA